MIPEASELNLDAMPIEDLTALERALGARPTRAVSRALFPTRPKGYTKAAHLLALYATNKRVAMQLRGDGDIRQALPFERACDRLYVKLPDWARGW